LASPQDAIGGGEGSIPAALELIREYEPREIIVGLPSNLKGKDTASTENARDWARQLEQATSIPIILMDERLTTVQATGALRAGGLNAKQVRSRVDSASAAIFLQAYLDRLAQGKGSS
jgi:putative Holliday junction resolvase